MSAEPLVAGALDDRRTGEQLAQSLLANGATAALSQAGALRVRVGDALFEFSGSKGEWILDDPCFADIPSLRAALDVLIQALAVCNIRCRFEVYEGNMLSEYRHVGWPRAVTA